MKLIDNEQQKVSFDGRTSEVVVRQRSGNRINGSFSAVSPLTNKKRVRTIMQSDVFDLLDQVSKGAFTVFNNLKYHRSEENNITRFTHTGEGMSKTDKEVLSRRIRELKNVGLIRAMKKEIPEQGTNKVFRFREPRAVFLINPDMIKCSNHEEAAYLWEQCG